MERCRGYENSTLVVYSNLMIALPSFFCPKQWENMSGDETERFCSKCRKTVHNIASLSLDQRIALMKAPKGSICGRYRIAVRRAIRGYEKPYMQHLLKYGAGVAASSAVFITLWQLYDDHSREMNRSLFRVGTEYLTTGCEMPEVYYHEDELTELGVIAAVNNSSTAIGEIKATASPSNHVDIALAPVELDKLLKPTESPRITFPPVLPPAGLIPKRSKIQVKI